LPQELPWLVPLISPPVEMTGAGGAGAALLLLSAEAGGASHIPSANTSATSFLIVRAPFFVARHVPDIATACEGVQCEERCADAAVCARDQRMAGCDRQSSCASALFVAIRGNLQLGCECVVRILANPGRCQHYPATELLCTRAVSMM
jgi:hypothetical protein